MVITTIRSNGTVAREIRRILCEHYDVEVKTQHTPDGEDILVELVIYSNGTLPAEKPCKRKRKRE